jgi:hypothetical protein
MASKGLQIVLELPPSSKREGNGVMAYWSDVKFLFRRIASKSLTGVM